MKRKIMLSLITVCITTMLNAEEVNNTIADYLLSEKMEQYPIPRAGSGKNLTPPTSPIAPIVPMEEISVDYYVGFGMGGIKMKDEVSQEEFLSNSYTLRGGANFWTYWGAEMRWTKSFGKMEYRNGDTQNNNYEDFPATLVSYGLLLKPHYNFKKIEVYGLVGYGYTSIDAIPLGIEGKANRTEGDLQYGLGLEYNVYSNISIYTDFFNAYTKKGIDGRAKNSEITVPEYSFGLMYKF